MSWGRGEKMNKGSGIRLALYIAGNLSSHFVISLPLIFALRNEGLMFRRSEEVRRDSWRLGERRIKGVSVCVEYVRWDEEGGRLHGATDDCCFLETQLQLAKVQAEYFLLSQLQEKSKCQKRGNYTSNTLVSKDFC